MKRVLLILLAVVLLLLGGAWLYIDHIAKGAVEVAGSAALGVKTTLKDIRLSLLKADLRLKGFVVGNPEGFPSPHFMRLDDGYLSVTARSLLADEVHVPVVELDGLEVHLDKEGSRTNYKIILDHLREGESEPSTGPGKRFRIDKVVVKKVVAYYDVLPIGGKITRVKTVIDRLELTDLSSDKGAPMGKIIGAVLKGILRGILEKGTDLPKDLAEGLGEGLKGVGDLLGGAAKKVGEGLGGLLGR